MKDFVIGLLKLRSSERRNVPAAKAHVWVNELCIEVEGSGKCIRLRFGLGLVLYTGVLVVSCFMWSGAIDS